MVAAKSRHKFLRVIMVLASGRRRTQMKRSGCVMQRIGVRVLTVGAVMFIASRCVTRVQALPLERFQSTFGITCEEGKRYCSAVLRGDDTLGRYTGVAISKSSVGEVEVSVSRSSKGRLVVESEDATEFSLTLSWDGDSNPEQLSSSGLNCIDLSQGKASAFIVPEAELEAECTKGGTTTGECPSFGIEARVFNPADPTGQRFSASRGRRNLLGREDVVIPFSNFLGQGPRGGAQFNCLGAVTLRFTFRDFSELEFSIGNIYSNGAEGLLAVATATTAPVDTSVVVPSAVSNLVTERAATAPPSGVTEPIASAEPQVLDSPIPVSKRDGDAPVPEISSASGSAPPSGMVESKGAQPSSMRGQVPPQVKQQDSEEAVYGELIKG